MDACRRVVRLLSSSAVDWKVDRRVVRRVRWVLELARFERSGVTCEWDEEDERMFGGRAET